MNLESKPDPVLEFIHRHGWRARASHLAVVLGRSEDEVTALRRRVPCAPLPEAKKFPELFALWHGRAPEDDDWPAPAQTGHGSYEWLSPEMVLLATLVGMLGVEDIAAVLTQHLRTVTGDPEAERTKWAVLNQMNEMGLQTRDVVGGITVATAGAQIGSEYIVRQAIAAGTLHARRVGRVVVIPYDDWQAWKDKRHEPPQGFVRLSSLREPLGIKSDSKLPEYAACGYVPTAVLCATPNDRKGNSVRGSWFIAPHVAEQLLVDRREGRPMPWHGKPLRDNLKTTYRLWSARRHPVECPTCAAIWGELGAPQDFDDYMRRYPPLEHGAKRHLTRVWTPGMTVKEVAAATDAPIEQVQQAIDNGALVAWQYRGQPYVARSDASRWLARKCPSGESFKSWASLETASQAYQFSVTQLQDYIADGTLQHKVGTDGAMRGITYVLRDQCARLRARLGYTLEEAARRAGVTPERMEQLLEGVNWRQQPGIPLDTVNAVIKRLESGAREMGFSLQEAAAGVGRSLEWVCARIDDGTVRVSKSKWNEERLYLTEPMMCRLLEAARQPEKERLDTQEWYRLTDAALDAKVSTGTIRNWVAEGVIESRDASTGKLYSRTYVRARARRYWRSVRFLRAVPPDWLQAELDAQADQAQPSHVPDQPVSA